MADRESGRLFVISAPSGTGKSSIVQRILEELPALEFSVSFTTRPSRAGEVDGKDYHFVDAGRFDTMIDEDAFLEWAEVHGERYGTGLAETRRVLASGRDLLLDVDVQGARAVLGGPLEAVAVMILPPDFETLQERLRGRGSEDDAQLALRLSKAREEAESYGRFDFLVINDDLEETVDDIRSIVKAERRRVARCEGDAQRILSTFPPRG